jgi:hypothetical protein
LFSAQTIADLIAAQMSKAKTKQSRAFQKSLASGISKATLILLNAVKVSRRNVIAGVKVECSGK